ncbi:MAG: DUF1007 family protein [Spirochaetales bacterium]|nr:DUF1007 family protein [Spirochaetales bacterium]
MTGSVRRIALSFILTLAPVVGAWAHPHVFMDARLEFELRGQALEGIWVEWVFDPVFSADVIGQFDRNHDGTFDDAESATVQARAFSNLKKYGYFTFVRQGERRYTPAEIQGFSASQRDGRAVYRFRVPLEGQGFADDVSVAAFDSTFYCAIRYLPDTATVTWLEEAQNEEPIITFGENKDYPVFYNPAGGTGDTRVYLKWERGLQTAYPEEIRVYFP